MSSGDGRDGRKTCCGSFCGFILTVGFVVLIYWAIFQPHQIRAAVDSASLSNLTVSASAAATVSYRLAVNLSLYNPSKRVNIYYDALGAELRLLRDGDGGAVIGQGPASPTEFYQRRKTGDVVALEFDGRDVGVPRDVAVQLEREVKGAAPAAVGLEVDVDLRVRYVFGAIKIRQKPRVRCWISVPVKASVSRSRRRHAAPAPASEGQFRPATGARSSTDEEENECRGTG